MHPPVLLAFHQVGTRSAKSQMAKVAELTRHHWQGRWHREGGFHSYDGCIPIVATTLELLREHGPAGPAFWRFGRKERQPLRRASGCCGSSPSPTPATATTPRRSVSCTSACAGGTRMLVIPMFLGPSAGNVNVRSEKGLRWGGRPPVLASG
ncbi:hypothetical protein OG512_48110 [Streptomyces sp. NBC_01378]